MWSPFTRNQKKISFPPWIRPASYEHVATVARTCVGLLRADTLVKGNKMMRKISMLIALTMLTAPLATPTSAMAYATAAPAPQTGNGSVLDYCTALIASGIYPTLNYGECVSFNSSSDAGFKTKFCDFVRETANYSDFGFKSYSDCVRNF